MQLRHHDGHHSSDESQEVITILPVKSHHRHFKSCFPNRKKQLVFNLQSVKSNLENTMSTNPSALCVSSVPLADDDLTTEANIIRENEKDECPRESVISNEKVCCAKETININSLINFDISISPINSRRFPRRHSMSVCTKVSESTIVTPLAIILARLGRVRQNIMSLTGTRSSNRFTSTNLTLKKILNVKNGDDIILSSHQDIKWKNMAKESLEELEWCLLQLTNVQTKQTIGDISTDKFKRVLDEELVKLSTKCKTANEVIDYIKSFLDSCQLEDSLKMEIKQMSFAQFYRNTDATPQIHSQPDLIGSSQIQNNKDSGSPTLVYMANKFGSQANQNVTAQMLDHEMYRNLGINSQNDSQINNMMDCYLGCWGLQIFDLDALTNQHSLVVVVLKILEKRQLLTIFSIDPITVVQYFLQIEMNYDRSIPYHNAVHAADVTQSVNVLLSNDALEDIFTELETLAVIFACAIHDVQHPGVTNQYLINIEHDLAILYNDTSVLENHHLAVAFRFLQKPGCNIFASLSRKQRHSIRKIVIDLVLATDMSRHMTLLSDLKVMVEEKKLSGSGILNFESYSDRLQILQNMVHCADLSNPTKPLPLYQEWTQRIMEEFFRQGDKERDSKLEISPMCDRATASIEKSQVSFIDFIVRPLWSTWAELVYPNAHEMLDMLESNREWYQYQLSQLKKNQEPTVDISKPSTSMKQKPKLFKIKTMSVTTHSSIEEEKDENVR